MGSGRCLAHVMPGARAQVVCQTLGKGHALASASATGDLSLDCRGSGSCRAHHHGQCEMAVLHEGRQDIVLTNRCSVPVMVHIKQEGEIHIFFTGKLRQIPAVEAEGLLIEPAGHITRQLSTLAESVSQSMT
ncbi:MAG: hypothetical protein QGF00_01755 [Planctomycetota bacterium]|nr:hypothetical protein [Planctomycetota bacterium]